MIRKAAPVLLLAAAFLTAGCLGLRRGERPPAGDALVVPGVPRIAFGTDRCGSGALASVLSAYGDPAPQQALDATLPRTQNGGVLSVDLLLAARSRGYPARLLPGTFSALQAALRQGIPPVLLLRVGDLPGRRRDLYHYVVVDGLVERERLVRVLLGDGEARWIAFDRLERPWRGGGHALLLVPRRTPPADALQAAVALEREGRLDEAAEAYAGLLRTAPSPTVWTNLGNVETARGRLDAAEEAYLRALALAADAPETLASLAWLRLLQGRASEAESLAERAATAAGPVRGLALDTVGRARLALGDCLAAAAAFRDSLEALPPGNEARPEAEDGLARATACAPSP